MNKPIVFTGNNVQQSNTEVLKPMSLFEICEQIRTDPDLQQEIERLRKVAMMDKAAYQRVKTRLPYFCCSTFENGIRKSDQFRSVTCFVMDIDKLPVALKEKLEAELKQDPRAKMIFTSPGGQGIKVVFELSMPCESLKTYSDFYKTFAFHIAETYKLQQYLDTSTCDATRVTFLSYDEHAWYNTINETVNISDYLPAEIFSIAKDQPNQDNTEIKEKEGLPEDLYRDILRKLNPDARLPKKNKQIHVPEALCQVEGPVRAEFARLGIAVKEIRDINYGKKFVFEVGFRFGEINLFYGSRGFSVVQSAKTGSDARLNNIGEMVIRTVLASGVKDTVLQSKEKITLN